ncbi:hypothetical protein Glove_131g53 [Diversispora epigaea]|uniref:Uncharacterized protein n=1 Tax=Diversispora epigaea TaxID=1348612 RepID=A0A397IY48_9GLOM|nr:hypothetical protein Glove_131g53 [Diversispora epigaea]
MLSWTKCKSPLITTEVYEERYIKLLPKEDDVYVEHHAILDAINLLVLFTHHTYSSAVTVRLNLKSYYDIETKDINLPDHQRVICQIESLHRIINKCKCEKKSGWSREHLYKLIYDARRIIVMDNDLTDLNIEWIKSLQKSRQFSVIYNTSVRNRKVISRLGRFSHLLLMKRRQPKKNLDQFMSYNDPTGTFFREIDNNTLALGGRDNNNNDNNDSDLNNNNLALDIEKNNNNIDNTLVLDRRNDDNTLALDGRDIINARVISSLLYEERKRVSYINPKFEWAFYLFKSYIETNARTNQMLFRIRCIKEYTCHIEQRVSNLPITEEGLFHWLLKVKQECLFHELQNKGIFPDVMVDFLKKAGMIISIIKTTPKPKENAISLIATVKANSSVIKAEKILNIANANILNHDFNHELAEILENKLKKTLGEIYALSRYHIADCYVIPPKFLTEDFITNYIEAIIREYYRNDRLITVIQAKKHQICLELLKTCTSVKDIDDKNRYKFDITKTNASRSTKKSGLKSDKAKLDLLNSVLFTTYEIKFKAIDNNRKYYHLVGKFDKRPFYENSEDIRYGYSKLSLNEIEISSSSDLQNRQDMFDIV